MLELAQISRLLQSSRIHMNIKWDTRFLHLEHSLLVIDASSVHENLAGPSIRKVSLMI